VLRGVDDQLGQDVIALAGVFECGIGQAVIVTHAMD
jgi:hypothetical protein